MTNEQNFKKGDKVRVKSTDIEDIVIDVCNGNVFLKDNGYWSAKVLELIEPLDRRTVFLRRLGALLREFDAKIYGGLSDIYDEDVLYIQIGVDRIAYRNGELNVCYPHINADNIMEFDKE